MENSSFNNGGTGISFLSLLMADDVDTDTRNQDEFHRDDELPPLPPSFDDDKSSFLFHDYHNLLLPAPVYSPPPSFNPSLFHGDYGLTNLKIEPPSLPSSSSPPPLMNRQDHLAPNYYALPELLSLENSNLISQPPPISNDDDDCLNLHQSKKQRVRRGSHRQTMSEKMYSLGKLLPESQRRRLKSAEVLEEAHKYIAFLQAQVAALWSMPAESRFHVAGKESKAVEVAALGRLSRQQLLQVVVNSPAAQSLMVDKGWCVVSAEQVALMKKMEARKRLVHHLLNHIPL